MSRSLDQIIAELNPTYAPQVESLQKQQAMIPGQIASQEQALNAQKDQGYADILSGARSRGTGIAFGGIPLAEQAKYNATQYAPALANLRQQGQQQAMSLQDAILNINKERNTTGQQIYQTEQDRAFQAEQNRLNRASTAAAAAQPTYGNPYQQASTTTAAQARAVQDPNNKGSFSFYDASNKPITAASYAKQTNQNLGDVLFEMGNSGDQTARQLYSQLANVSGSPKLYQQTLDVYTKQFPYIFGGL